MAKSNTKIIYDKGEDILYLSRGNPAKASIEVGDFIIDIDFKGFVSAIEILNASENLQISPDFLEKVNNARMSVTYRPDYLFIMLVFKLENKEKEVAIPLTLDLGHKEARREETIFVR
jgi:uncharacterized protein YuzE